MPKNLMKVALILAGVVVAFIITTAAPPAAAVDEKQCYDAFALCAGTCPPIIYGQCQVDCATRLAACLAGNPLPGNTTAGNAQPPSTAPPVTPPTSGLPTTGAGPTLPPSGTSPTKWGGSPLPGKGSTQPTSGGGSTTPPSLTGVHPVYPVNPNPGKINEPGTGTSSGTTPIYDKSGGGTTIGSNLPNAGSGVSNTQTQDLIKSWQQKVNDKNSVLYKGQTPGGTGSVSSNVKSQIFNQTLQKHKEKGMNEFFHEQKPNVNQQNLSAPTPSHGHSGRR